MRALLLWLFVLWLVESANSLSLPSLGNKSSRLRWSSKRSLQQLVALVATKENKDDDTSLQNSSQNTQGLDHKPLLRRFQTKLVELRQRPLTKVLALATCLWLGLAVGLPQAAVAKPVTSPSTPAILGKRNIGLAGLLLLSLGAVPLSLTGLSALSKSLVVSASRCSIQVFLLGSVLLERIMGIQHPGLVLLWILGVGGVATREAFSRIQYTYPNLQRDILRSVLIGGGTVLAASSAGSILGSLQPWFQPRTWIPVAGMLFGNTLSAVALASSSITQSFASRRDQVELRLAYGATWQEAALPLVQESLSTALTPTINSLAVTGIVHIPGMMTGQILAGQPVSQAALYQILINFLIATTACTTVQLLIRAATTAIMDPKHHRLSSNSLRHRDEEGNDLDDTSSSPKLLQTVALHDNESSKTPLLEVKEVGVSRANTKISLKLHEGARIGLLGKSGSGKSQILRTLAGLEEESSGVVELHGSPIHDMPVNRYRKKVCLVAQSRPTIEGTPRQFYDQILRYQSQSTSEPSQSQGRLLEYIKSWGLEKEKFDQQWSTLSGGEAQRISLAMALSLEPEVLLLDESTSALDDEASRSVEATLKEMKIPMLVVTHSGAQLERFCTQSLDLSETIS